MLNFCVRQWGCDFLSACGRKGLRAIEGSGFMFVKEAHITSMTPCLVGWWNTSFVDGEFVLPETAKRFEAGCPITPAIYSLDTALDIANQIGLQNINQRVLELTHYALSQLSTIDGFEFYGPQSIEGRLGLIPFNIKGVDPNKLVVYLEQKKLIIEAGHFMAAAVLDTFNIKTMGRISLHYFNDEQQLDRLLAAIQAFTERET